MRPYLYRGDKMNIELALKFEARLKGRFAWNAFRNRVEVVQRTPWCNRGMVEHAQPDAARIPGAA